MLSIFVDILYEIEMFLMFCELVDFHQFRELKWEFILFPLCGSYINI